MLPRWDDFRIQVNLVIEGKTYGFLKRRLNISLI